MLQNTCFNYFLFRNAISPLACTDHESVASYESKTLWYA